LAWGATGFKFNYIYIYRQFQTNILNRFAYESGNYVLLMKPQS
jgi:hypothetical protein